MSVAGLEPGTYCLELDAGANSLTPSQQIIELLEEGEVIVDFAIDLDLEDILS